MVRRSRVLALAIALPLVASFAIAQEPRASGKVVIVLDLSSDATENAKLRARAYERARQSGYEADTKADVNGAATRVGALEAGRVSRDDTNLQALRAALGATALVRVSEEWTRGATRGVKVSVAVEGGVRSKIVEAPVGDPGPVVEATVAELLAPEGAASPPVEAEAEPAPVEPAPQDGRTTSGGWRVFGGQTDVRQEEKTLEDPGVRREAWRQRGGARVTYEARAQVVGLRLANVQYSDVVPANHPRAGQTDRGEGDVLGIGGGLAARFGLFILPLPEPVVGNETGFAAFRLGLGGDLSFVFVQRPVGFSYEPTSQGARRSEDTENETLMLADIPIQVGIHGGFGRFHSSSIWRGIVLGVAYTPTFQFELNIDRSVGGDSEGGPKNQTRFNYGAAEVMVDIVTLEATADGGPPQPQIRIVGRVLPPLEDDWPLIVSLGLGAAWY